MRERGGLAASSYWPSRHCRWQRWGRVVRIPVPSCSPSAIVARTLATVPRVNKRSILRSTTDVNWTLRIIVKFVPRCLVTMNPIH